MSPSRRWAALVALLASGAVLGVLLISDDDTSVAVAAPGGNVALCTSLEGEPARACYAREVGRELAAVGGSAGTPRAVFSAPSDGANVVTFATGEASSAALLCDLHIRVGATDESKPSWTSWVAQ